MTKLGFAAQLAMQTHKFNFWKQMYIKSMNYMYCHAKGESGAVVWIGESQYNNLSEGPIGGYKVTVG